MKIESKKILEYIDLLLKNSFEGWDGEAIKGYNTSAISIREKIKSILYEQQNSLKTIKSISEFLNLLKDSDVVFYKLVDLHPYNIDVAGLLNNNLKNLINTINSGALLYKIYESV